MPLTSECASCSMPCDAHSMFEFMSCHTERKVCVSEVRVSDEHASAQTGEQLPSRRAARSAMQNARFTCTWTNAYALLQGTLFVLFLVIELLEIVFISVSWEHIAYMISPAQEVKRRIYRSKVVAVFATRVALIILIACVLLLISCKSVTKAEQVTDVYDLLLRHAMNDRDVCCRNSYTPSCSIITLSERTLGRSVKPSKSASARMPAL